MEVQEVAEFFDERSTKKEMAPPTNNQTIVQLIKDRGGKAMLKDGAESIRIHRAILEMMALHNRPFTIVEDVGMLFVFSLLNASFVCSGADHFATVVLQDCLRWAVFTMSQELVKQRSLYFTSDLWLCQLTSCLLYTSDAADE